MPVGKKLAVALSVLATGVSSAFFFRKDVSQVIRQEASPDNPFSQRVERRVAGDPLWVDRGRQPARADGPAAQATTAWISEPASPLAAPKFQTSVSPVGALLKPIDVASEEDSQVEDRAVESSVDPPAARQTHRISDGDTLSNLAQRYLGRADRYLEIFELNRELLTSPDLLPIGAVLQIPPTKSRRRGGLMPATLDAADAPQMVPVSPPQRDRET